MNLFENEEDLWFWYHTCLKLKESKQCYCRFERPCEPMDITILIQRLHETGMLLTGHLITLKTFGKQGFKPDHNIHGKHQRDNENRDERIASETWREAMLVLNFVFKQKGFIK